jgi:hypothetical protein
MEASFCFRVQLDDLAGLWSPSFLKFGDLPVIGVESKQIRRESGLRVPQAA